ncbi:MAG TPA: VOC family protein [Candidatus Cybelea sp.]|jgi:hypothetical protein
MSQRSQYPPGTPCWVDVLAADPDAELRFYADLFGWEYAGPGPMPSPDGKYYVARVGGLDVAGVASAPPELRGAPAFWETYVCVADVDESCALAELAGATILVAPFEAGPAGRVAVFDDPSGAALCLWEPKGRTGAQVINEPSAWAMSTLFTADIERAKTFYHTLFGWEWDTFAAGAMSATLCRLPGYVGGEPAQPVPRDVVGVMIERESAAGVPPHWSVDFWIDDVDAGAARAAQGGATLLVPPHDAAGFRRCVIADPAGAAFTISKLATA